MWFTAQSQQVKTFTLCLTSPFSLHDAELSHALVPRYMAPSGPEEVNESILSMVHSMSQWAVHSMMHSGSAFRWCWRGFHGRAWLVYVLKEATCHLLSTLLGTCTATV